VYEKMHNKDVALLLDGGTLVRQKHLNFMVGTDEGPLFLRSVRVPHVDAETVHAEIDRAINDLAEKDIHVLALVADNASAMLSGMADFSIDYEDDVEDVCQALTDGVEEAATKRGLYVFRCAAHSLQLCLKDLPPKVPCIRGAMTAVDPC